MRNNSTWALSALSPMPWPREAFRIPLTLLTAFGAIFFSVVPSIVYLIAGAFLGFVDPRHPKNIAPDQLLLAQIVTYAPLGMFLVFSVPRVAHVSLRELGLRMPTARELGIGLAGTVAMWLLVSLTGAIVAAVSHRHDTETAVALLQQMKTPAEQVLFFAIACMLAPMIEELTFRVFLYNALTRYVSMPVAIVASGLIFGVVHSASLPQLLTVSLPLTVGGIVLAYVYARTRSYWACVTTHALFNSVSVVAIFVFHAKP
ncbi:MAG: hypothetical protein NVSMB19_04240 [Vulcanimicrobiaceae bacterium]